MSIKCSDPAVLAGLFLAAYSGNLADVRSLLKNNALSADVSDPIKGSTALQWACSGGSLEVVEWLVKEGGAKVGHRNKDDRTAFFFACEHCHKPVASFLVNQAGVDVNAKDGPSGHSPLHRACIAGQTREQQAKAMDLILWLLTSAKADAKAADLSGRKPGEADLTAEAPNLKPAGRAAEISKTLEDARRGVAPGTTTTNAAAAPAAAAAEPARAQARALAPSSPNRPGNTVVVAARAAVTKIASPARPASPVRAAASPARMPVSPVTVDTSPARVDVFSGRLATSPMRVAASPVKVAVSPVNVAASPPPYSFLRAASPTRAARETAAREAAAREAAAREAATREAAARETATREAAAREAAARAAVSAKKPSPVSAPSPVAVAYATRSTTTSSSSSSSSSAPVSSVRGGVSPLLKAPSSPLRVAVAAPSQRAGSPSRIAIPTSETTNSPRAGVDAAAAPWSHKPRAGGVSPRDGGKLPVTASSARPGSPAAKTAAAAAAVTSATSSSYPSSSSPAPTVTTPRLLRKPSYRLRKTPAAAAPAAAAASPAIATALRPTAIAPSPAPVARFQPSGGGATGAANSATGTAAAVIGASNGPKASALAAAFETKARGREGTVPTSVPRRGSPGLASSGLAARAPALSSSHSAGSNGGSSDRPAATSASQRPIPPQAPQSATTASRITPEELLGKSSVMERKKVYVAAALKGGQGGPKSPKTAPVPMLGKDKKVKDGSFMDKFVSMFSISPQSSPATSPTRSTSKSPRPKQRSPAAANSPGPAKAAEPARMGFFNTNMSFKLPESTEKE